VAFAYLAVAAVLFLNARSAVLLPTALPDTAAPSSAD
jgi:hypothetical protein